MRCPVYVEGKKPKLNSRSHRETGSSVICMGSQRTWTANLSPAGYGGSGQSEEPMSRATLSTPRESTAK